MNNTWVRVVQWPQRSNVFTLNWLPLNGLEPGKFCWHVLCCFERLRIPEFSIPIKRGGQHALTLACWRSLVENSQLYTAGINL